MIRRIIACEVFHPYIDYLATLFPIEKVDYLEIKQHDHPALLAMLLQEKIDQIKEADEILILYGLCGNAILPLRARSIPIRVLRAHDCAAVLLGSTKAYQDMFEGKPNKQYHCLTYGNSEDSYFSRTSPEFIKIMDEYGEDNAEYAYKTIYSQVVRPITYIQFGFAGEQEQIAEHEIGYYTIVDGDLGMLVSILGNKDDSDTIILHSGERFEGIYDYKVILKVIPDND